MKQRGQISITKTFKDLHWLPVKYCIDFKEATLTHKVLQYGEPTYLSLIIDIDAPLHALRSSSHNHRLTVFQSKTKIGSRAFRHSAPSIWNSPPIDIRNAASVQSFKNCLRTFYFQQAFKLVNDSPKNGSI